jgi:hypothetical protein
MTADSSLNLIVDWKEMSFWSDRMTFKGDASTQVNVLKGYCLPWRGDVRSAEDILKKSRVTVRHSYRDIHENSQWYRHIVTEMRLTIAALQRMEMYVVSRRCWRLVVHCRSRHHASNSPSGL